MLSSLLVGLIRLSIGCSPIGSSRLVRVINGGYHTLRRRVRYLEPVGLRIGFAVDSKEIVENLSAAILIGSRILKVF